MRGDQFRDGHWNKVVQSHTTSRVCPMGMRPAKKWPGGRKHSGHAAQANGRFAELCGFMRNRHGMRLLTGDVLTSLPVLRGDDGGNSRDTR